MKNNLIFNLSGWLLSTIIISSSFAQEKPFKVLSPITISSASNMVSVNAKVNKAFGQFFKDATNLRWEEKNKKYLVEFLQNDLQNRALFAKNGNLIYHICFGNEINLPQNVRRLIKREYFDQNITRVIKVNQQKKTIWVVSMEDAKEYIYVRIEDMELEETQRIQKAE
jgi:hypothetical protein